MATERPIRIEVGPRTEAWNRVRTAIREACVTAPGEGPQPEYAASSNAAEILSCASSALRWAGDHQEVPQGQRVRWQRLCTQTEDLFAIAKGFGILEPPL